jgi:hypothetical protein
MLSKTWIIRGVVPMAALAFTVARSQQQPAQSMAERFKAMSEAAEKRGLAEPYRGITVNGVIQPGLFPIHSTGVSTEPVRKAAAAFLATLTPEQRAKTTFPVDDVEWRKWMNQDFYVRQGVSFKEMDARQRDVAFGLMRSALSAKGMKLSRDIMRLNYTLGELNHDDFVRYGEWLYWITVMGEPSKDKPWGFQVDGHHLILNYFVLGGQVVMTPAFFGSEPVIAPSGKYKGLAVLQDEQSLGLKMLLALNETQRKKAVLEVSKTGNNNLGEAFKDNFNLDYTGVPVSSMTPAQKKELQDLIALYVDNMDDGHAKVKMTEVNKHLNETYFAWIGGMDSESVYYYRIHSPVILIEFDHQRPANLRHLAANPQVPNRQHIHCVIRTPNGNDYGKDLLRQHYAMFKH